MTIVYQQCPVCESRKIGIVLTARDNTVSQQIFDVWKCSDCTLRFTQSIPGPEEISRFYQSEAYISHSDTTEGFINSLYHKVRSHTLSSKKNLVKNQTALSRGKILDVGAGTGAFLNVMQKAGWQVTGIEPDDIARKNASSLYNLALQPGEDLYNLPEGSFDAITLWHVLEHVYDLHKYIIWLRKLLKPNGVLFIAVPNYTCYDARVYRANWAAYDVPRHLYHFSPASMRYLLNMHQLVVKKTRPMWFDSFYVSMLSEKYRTGNDKYARAVLVGLISNFKALFNKEKCSSVMYLVKKQS